MEEEEAKPIPWSGDSNPPEFEFWMTGNPSCPQPNLLSADELFADGFVVPLYSLNLSDELPQLLSGEIEEPRIEKAETLMAGVADMSASSGLSSSSKKWMDIFRRSDKKMPWLTSEKLVNEGDKEISRSIIKEKKREKKNGMSVAGSAELNINIWPFSRSRSAGTGCTRPRSAVAPRKVRSAPCSRSNSAGESESRKWPRSPGRTGIHVGRISPVWQVRRGGSGRKPDTFVNNVQKGTQKEVNQGRRRSPVAQFSGFVGHSKVLTLDIPMCIGYRHPMSCSNDKHNTAAGNISGDGVSRNHLFNIRKLFSQKFPFDHFPLSRLKCNTIP